MRALDAAEMVAFETWAMEEIGMPQGVLMENAARGAVEALLERFPDCRDVLVLAGPGNNGGDGLAMMRMLLEHGVTSRALALEPPDGSLCARQREMALNLGLAVEALTAETLRRRLSHRPPCVVVDAVFGTGLSRPLEGELAGLMSRVRESTVPVVAVDVPTGIDASRAQLLAGAERCVARAELTVTFAAPKIAHLLDPARELCGEVRVVGLGLPFENTRLVESGVLPPGGLFESTAESVGALLPRRAAAAHKGTFGHLLVIGGSPGLSGAAVLTARGALRSGVGLVTVAVPEPLLEIVEAASLESMTLPLATASGTLSVEAVPRLLEAAHSRDAVALGPGLGPEGYAAVRAVLAAVDVPLVLDADGLNALEGDLALVAARSAPTVLTPHPGELARLLGCTAAEIEADRLEAVREASERSRATVLLKGHQTLIAERADDDALSVWVNRTGNPGMATGGSGDVLTGVVGSLLAQGLRAGEAARAAAHLHGAAGDLASALCGQQALTAGDLADALGRAWRELEAGS